MIRRELRRASISYGAVLALAVACLNDSSPGLLQPDSMAGLRLNAQIAGLAPGAANYTVTVAVSYHGAGSALESLLINRSSFSVGASQEPSTDTLVVDLTKCLGDGAREGAELGGCRLMATLALTDGEGTELDSQSQELGTVQPGQVVTPPQPFTLVARPGAPVRITIALAVASLQVGETTGATALVQDDQGREVTDAIVEWISSAEAVATVIPPNPESPVATVTATGEGTAEIRARTGGLTSNPIVVSVAQVPAVVMVSLERSSLVVNATTTATAVVRNAQQQELTGQTVVWRSSNDQVATITTLDAARATVTAVSAGATEITATVGNGAAAVSSRPVTVQVNSAPTLTVDVTLDLTTIALNATATATAVVRDAEGNTLTGQALAWRSSAANVATVATSSPFSAVVTGVSLGEADITASLLSDPAVESPPVRVQVIAPPPASIHITLGTSLTIGQEAPASATVTDDHNNVLTEPSVEWVSTRRDVVDVTKTGLQTATLTGLSVGNTQIQATLGAIHSNTVAVTVSLVPTKLVLTQQPPATIEATSPFTVKVAVEDAEGRLVRSYTDQVRLSLKGGASGAILGGTLTSTPESGVATFDGLTIDRVGNGYSVLASSGTLPDVVSGSFNVTVTPSPIQSTVVAVPSSITAGSETATITVTGRDAKGAPIANAEVQLSATGSENTLLLDNRFTDDNGVATGTLSSMVPEVKTITATINGFPVEQTATVTVTPALFTLTLIGAGSGSGSVFIDPENIDPPDKPCVIIDGFANTGCSATYPMNTPVTLTARASGDDVFDGWKGGGCSGTGECVVTLTQAQSVFAIFTRRFSLTVQGAGNGRGRVTSEDLAIDCVISASQESGTCSALYPTGASVFLIQSEAQDIFGGWDGPCIFVFNKPGCAVLMDRTQTVTATFTDVVE
jgi:Invasin, domain 3/Bacterial Ig-like domain (group 2)